MTEAFNIDCMEAMAQMRDNAFDLCICDPPYGINASQMKLGEGGETYRKPKKYKRGNWDTSSPYVDYFVRLMTISRNQIIWGANHFISKMAIDSKGWIVWDKNNGDTSFADAELAWSSFDVPVRIYKYTWSGYIQGKMGANKETRIHPTQKPIALYKWLLKNYAKEGDRILDTHLGSGSSRIAAYDMGFDFVGYEIDKDYFDAQEKRFQNHIKQQSLFKPKDMY